MQVSQRIEQSTLEQLNLADASTEAKPKTILIAKKLLQAEKKELKNLLRQYKDVFPWSFEDMKGLDPTFCQHQINLHRDAKPVQQHHYRLNRNYAVKVKEEIDKLLRAGFIRPIKWQIGSIRL